MSHEDFLENDAAIIWENENDILTALEKICAKPDVMDEYAEKAVLSAKKNHDPKYIRAVFDKVILATARNNLVQIEDRK